MSLNAGRPRIDPEQKKQNRREATRRYQQSQKYREYKKQYCKERYLASKKQEAIQLVADHYNNLRGQNTVMTAKENERYEKKVEMIMLCQTATDLRIILSKIMIRWQ